jgi:ATP-binding cassette subfamily E protein 1
VKPQYVDQLPKAVKGADRTVSSLIKARAEMGNLEEILDELELRPFLDRDINNLSGGELQRFAIGTVCAQKADVYMFDEVSVSCHHLLKSLSLLQLVVAYYTSARPTWQTLQPQA